MSIDALNSHSKITPGHLKKTAYLYIRQSTLRQVFENTESTQRQYALRQRAIVLGWPAEHIEIIDCDQGQSGASTAEREGFQKLVAEVGLGKAGIVMGLEVSRLARNCADWHRLLEICALSGTLILDEDGLYDPGHFNDRLLLGLKGTMSEAELHVLKARLRGGILSKAQRGELKMPLPVGLIYDPAQRVVFDPDKQLQNTLRNWLWKWPLTSSRNSKSAWLSPTVCVASMSSGPNMKPSKLVSVICAWTRTIVSWPIRWRRSGTTSSGNWSKRVRIAKNNGKAANGQ
jgi:DNA invertase Pin-like site-specific DNA recombinase